MVLLLYLSSKSEDIAQNDLENNNKIQNKISFEYLDKDMVNSTFKAFISHTSLAVANDASKGLWQGLERYLVSTDISRSL